MRLLKGLAGKLLACGCFVGVYETYEGGVIASIDARGPQCADRAHGLHEIVPIANLDRPAVSASAQPTAPRL
jgi:hypothetical protein